MLIELLFCAVACVGWSVPSHRIIARVAAKKLTKEAREFVRVNLRDAIPPPSKRMSWSARIGFGMAAVSTWADTVKESRAYHFSHTPEDDCQKFVEERDCPNGFCLVTGMKRYAKEATDPSSSALKRAEALKYLIHLVADATQPLHTGFAKDHGATTLFVESPVYTSLHMCWDYDILNTMMKEYPETFGGREGELIASVVNHPVMSEVVLETDLKSGEFAKKLVSHTSVHFTCTHAYRNAAGQMIQSSEQLDDEYIEDRAYVVIEQLARASTYLAQVINFVAAQCQEVCPQIDLPIQPKMSDPAEEADSSCSHDEEMTLSFTPEVRKPYVVFGIDLTKIMLRRFEGRLLVTSHEAWNRVAALVMMMMFGESLKPVEVIFDMKTFYRGVPRHILKPLFESVKDIPKDVVDLIKSPTVGKFTVLESFDAVNSLNNVFSVARKRRIPTSREIASEHPPSEMADPQSTTLYSFSDFFSIASNNVVLLALADLQLGQDQYRFRAVPHKAAQGEVEIIYLLEDRLEALTHKMIDNVMMKLRKDKSNADRVASIYKKDERLLLAIDCIGKLASGGAEPCLTGLRELVRIERPYYPGILSIGVVVDRAEGGTDGRDVAVCHLGDGLAAVPAHLMSTELPGAVWDLHLIPATSAHPVLYLDQAIFKRQENLSKFVREIENLIKQNSKFDRAESLGMSRKARVLNELNQMMTRRGGTRNWVTRYEKVSDGNSEILRAFLKPRKGKFVCLDVCCVACILWIVYGWRMVCSTGDGAIED